VPRITFTTRCRDSGLYHHFRENAPRNFRWRFGMPRKISFALRFLKQNPLGLTIAEYPTRSEYSELLKRGWDAAGFSCYPQETHDGITVL
jgi:preprotein translocase subunit Sss1